MRVLVDLLGSVCGDSVGEVALSIYRDLNPLVLFALSDFS